LVETFLDKAEDLPHLGKQFVPQMMDPVLGDYAEMCLMQENLKFYHYLRQL
jgi:hypothetical protein